MKTNGIKAMTLCALFTAIMAVCAQLAVPTGSVNMTLQTFGAAICGYALGVKRGTSAICAYLALGAVGVPIFSSFTGGVGVLFGATGGFLWGFIPLCLFCALCIYVNQAVLKITLSLIGLILCHIIGILQFWAVVGGSFQSAAVAASLYYIVKDILLIMAAYFVTKKLRETKIL